MSGPGDGLRGALGAWLEEARAFGLEHLPRGPVTETPDAPAPREGGEGEAAAALEALAGEVAACTRCGLHQGRTCAVPGQGSPRAPIMFVGEAPGAEEDRQGLAFVGRAGQLLTRMIKAMGFQREEVFIANVLKCRPPGNRDPRPDEAAACSPYLRRQIEILRPGILVALGGHAARTLLQTAESVGRLRGRLHAWHETPLVVTYHPAYLLRNPADKKKAWEDLKFALRQIGLEPPPAQRKPAGPPA